MYIQPSDQDKKNLTVFKNGQFVQTHVSLGLLTYFPVFFVLCIYIHLTDSPIQSLPSGPQAMHVSGNLGISPLSPLENSLDRHSLISSWRSV